MTKNQNVQNPLDISVFAKPQYDKVDFIASECKPISSPPPLARSDLGVGKSSHSTNPLHFALKLCKSHSHYPKPSKISNKSTKINIFCTILTKTTKNLKTLKTA
ncbi:hypothetical protein CQA40_07500 [Helicobacter sp. MIT 01-3238]|nr:hypothetical protein CQA40_07500 [Helicobacter sp. MIT 01-3238]